MDSHWSLSPPVYPACCHEDFSGTQLDFAEVVNGAPASTVVPPPSGCWSRHCDLCPSADPFFTRLRPNPSLPDLRPFLSAVFFFPPLVQLLSNLQIKIQILPSSELFLITSRCGRLKHSSSWAPMSFRRSAHINTCHDSFVSACFSFTGDTGFEHSLGAGVEFRFRSF